jgi:uroporphyrinogen-III synthase
MKTLLSTKILSSAQKEPLVREGIQWVEYDAISIRFIDFKVPETLGNLIFTSQNSVLAFLKKSVTAKTGEIRCFCVGEKTSQLLNKNRLKVVKIAQNASELVDFIIKYHKSEKFSFFCGSRRREEIPTALKKAKIEFIEVKTYETELNLAKFDQKWDIILFFSPSGVESFVQGQNSEHMTIIPDNTTAICIGETTASEAKKHTKNVVISEITSIESVIDKAIEIFKGKLSK